jgi:hypothetical protein
MQGTIQFIQTTPEEQENRMFDRLKPEFEALKRDFQPKEPTEFLTRNEVKDLLKVDISTVHNWTKRGKIQAYGIAGRIYYKRSEIEQSIKPLNF